jgi:membrane protease YdiL (CAAX protease family)
MKNKALISVIAIITFIISTQVKYLYAYALFGVKTWNAMDELTANILVTLFQFTAMSLVAWLIIKKSPFLVLGLNTGFFESLKWALLCCIPIFIGYPCIASFNHDINLNGFYSNLISAGFFEEFMYRGFLFGILFFYAGWGFVPAIIIPSLIFASGHLYQAHDLGSAISVFAFTTVASVGFALAYIIWKSLWMPIFMHAFMDITWELFNLHGGAVGNGTANIFRFTAIGLAIFFTIRKARTDKASLKGKLWLNPAGRL